MPFRIAVFALCMLGINLLLLPWMRIRAVHSNTVIDEQYLYSDGSFDYRSGVFAEIVAKGTDLWQGIGTTIVCLAVMMTIMLSALVHHRGYRVGLMLAGGLIVYLAIGVMFDHSFPMISRVQFAAAPDALMKEMRERQGALSDVAFVEREAQERRVTLHRQMLPGVPAVMALGALLIAAGIAETVQARGKSPKSIGMQKPAFDSAGAARQTEEGGIRPTPPLGLLLVVAAGLVLGGLMTAAGVVMGVVGILLQEPGTHQFWGWMGGAIGCIGGGLGSTVGSWNSYRQLSGRRDLMIEPGWTWLDFGVAVYAGIGAAATLDRDPRLSKLVNRQRLFAGSFGWNSCRHRPGLPADAGRTSRASDITRQLERRYFSRNSTNIAPDTAGSLDRARRCCRSSTVFRCCR